jgi:hypothetical protein
MSWQCLFTEGRIFSQKMNYPCDVFLKTLYAPDFCITPDYRISASLAVNGIPPGFNPLLTNLPVNRYLQIHKIFFALP